MCCILLPWWFMGLRDFFVGCFVGGGGGLGFFVWGFLVSCLGFFFFCHLRFHKSELHELRNFFLEEGNICTAVSWLKTNEISAVF